MSLICKSLQPPFLWTNSTIIIHVMLTLYWSKTVIFHKLNVPKSMPFSQQHWRNRRRRGGGRTSQVKDKIICNQARFWFLTLFQPNNLRRSKPRSRATRGTEGPLDQRGLDQRANILKQPTQGTDGGVCSRGFASTAGRLSQTASTWSNTSSTSTSNPKALPVPCVRRCTFFSKLSQSTSSSSSSSLS